MVATRPSNKRRVADAALSSAKKRHSPPARKDVEIVRLRKSLIRSNNMLESLRLHVKELADTNMRLKDSLVVSINAYDGLLRFFKSMAPVQ